MKRLTLLLFLLVFLSGFVSAVEPFCAVAGGGSDQEVCFLWKGVSLDIREGNDIYRTSLVFMDDDGAEFLVNGKSTGYLKFEERKLSGGLIIQAGEVEFDQEMGSNVIVFLYEKASFWQKIKCLFSKKC